MTSIPGPALESLHAVIFQYSGQRLELLNGEVAAFPGLTRARLTRIFRGEWEKLVPVEFHTVVKKLGEPLKSLGHATVEFPVYWMGSAVWLRVFAAEVSETGQKRKLIGLVQDVTSQRHHAPDAEPHAEPTPEEDEDHWRKTRHDISSSLTSILMNCELLRESSSEPAPRRRIEAILSAALRIDNVLQQYHG